MSHLPFRISTSVEFLIGLGRSVLRIGARVQVEADRPMSADLPRLPPPVSVAVLVALIELAPKFLM